MKQGLLALLTFVCTLAVVLTVLGSSAGDIEVVVAALVSFGAAVVVWRRTGRIGSH